MSEPVSRQVIVRCVHGLEWICAAELEQKVPTAGPLDIDRRELTFQIPTLIPGLLDLTTADDVYLEVGRVGGTGAGAEVPARLAARLADLPWAERISDVAGLRPMPAAPLIDVVASLEGRRHYNRFAIEKVTGGLLADLTSGSYLERTATGRAPGDPDLTARLFVRGDVTIAALRLGARPLHRRDYKLSTAAGTLHPPVAAALGLLAGPGPGEWMLDPFCGDGTIAIETARFRPEIHMQAADLDPQRVRNTTENAKRAEVPVHVSVADAGSVRAAGGATVDVVITNPPWNRAVAGAGVMSASLTPFWRRLPDLLARQGRLVVIADSDHELPAALRAADFRITLTARIRLAGRLCDVVLAAPVGHARAALPTALATAREQAMSAGVITRSGF